MALHKKVRATIGLFLTLFVVLLFACGYAVLFRSFFLFALLVIAVVVGIVIFNYIYIDRSVLSRLHQLSAEVRQIGVSGSVAQVVGLAGNDELAGLAGDINVMLDALEQSRREVYASEARLRNITDNMLDMITQTDALGMIQYASPSYETILGDKPEDLLGKSFLELVHPDDVARIMQAVQEGIRTSTGKLEFRCRHADGHYLWFETVGKTLVDDDGFVTGAIFVSRDVTERRQTEERLKYLSFHDILTGLYNRSYFEEELKRLDTGRQLPLGVITVDVDDLKLVNDTLGHQTGDRLLIEAAGILRGICRRDDIACRWGGDEFSILLPKTTKESAERICNRIRKASQASEAGSVPLSLSLGAAVKEHAGQAMEAVFRAAEDAMYRDKLLDGRSTRFSLITFFQRALAEKSPESLEHGQRLRGLVVRIGDRLGLSSRERDELGILATLHDIGQIAIPGALLMKPDYLTAEEWELMKKHPEIGERITRSAPDLIKVAEAILSHHEYWDGRGYPRGLTGEQIPLLARILAITDAYDVMTNGRPYKKAVSHAEAVSEIKKCAGTQFDPELVRIFVEIMVP